MSETVSHSFASVFDYSQRMFRGILARASALHAIRTVNQHEIKLDVLTTLALLMAQMDYLGSTVTDTRGGVGMSSHTFKVTARYTLQIHQT